MLPTRVVDGIEVTRKVYVPATGLAFARQVDIFENPGFTPVTATVRWHGNLNADGLTTVERTSSGDMTLSRSATSGRRSGRPTPRTATTWRSPASGTARAARTGSAPSDWTASWAPPMGSPISSIWTTTSSSRPSAGPCSCTSSTPPSAILDQQQFAQTHAGNMAAFTAGMEPAELEALRNWPVFDRDGYGILEGADNCRSTPNPTQADLDGDGAGDAGDLDDDADGLPDLAEPGLGTDPRRAYLTATDSPTAATSARRSPTRAPAAQAQRRSCARPRASSRQPSVSTVG